jgi:galactokinase
MVQDCTVPFGSGLSSSAAIEVSTIAALATVAGESFEPVQVALAAQQAEREYAGVNCGIMDQYASACGKKNQVMLLDCKTLDCEYLPLNLGEYALVIIDCKKPHNLVESKYNERRAQTEEALAYLQKQLSCTCLADVSPVEFAACAHVLPDVIRKRAQHVVDECARVEMAKQALQEGNIKLLGKLLNASHNSLRDLYEVTGKELDVLAETAQRHPACVGSRMTGGGFGGCTISLVKKDKVDDFEATVLPEYKNQTGYEAKCYAADIADGITVQKL